MRERRLWRRKHWWRWGPLFAQVNLDSINLPRLRWDWFEPHRGALLLEWGNGNSDPVWSVAVDIWVPW